MAKANSLLSRTQRPSRRKPAGPEMFDCGVSRTVRAVLLEPGARAKQAQAVAEPLS